jgi:hypothetical protein
MIKAMQAEEATGTDKATATKDAIDALTAYRDKYPDSWQYTHAARKIVDLQMDVGDFAAAGRTLDSLTRMPELPKSMKEDLELQLIDVLMRTNQTSQAVSKIKAIKAALPANSPQAKRLEVYEIGATSGGKELSKVIGDLEAIASKTTDNGLKALAYNTMGDLYKSSGKPRDAMWSYLWVDQVYFQDRSEHLKAVDRLARLFKEDLTDPKNQTRYEEKLQRLK